LFTHFTWLAALALLAACRQSNPAWMVRVDAADDRAARDAIAGGADAGATSDAASADRPPIADTEPPAADADAGPGAADSVPGPADAGSDPPPPADAAVDAPVDAAAPDLAPDAPPATLTVPVAHWRLDSGGTVARDELGRNDGTLANGAAYTAAAAPVQFANAGAVQLDGADDHVRLGAANLPALMQAKSMSLWYWTATDTRSIQRKCLLVMENLTAQVSVQLGIEYGAVALWTWASASARIAAPQPAALSQWHHVGYTYDGQTHRLYADGALIGTSTFTVSAVATTDVFLGLFHPVDEPKERFGGRIDDVRIYDRALSAGEIAALAAGRP
jgi:hypothetical protein